MQKLVFSLGFAIVVLAGCKKNNDVIVLPVVPPVVAVDLSIPSDSVKLDPYGYAPLSALINFKSPVSGKAVIKVKGKHGPESDISHTFADTGLNHSVTIIGLYPDYLNDVNIWLLNTTGDTVAKALVQVQTGPLPAKMPTSIEQDIYPNGNTENGLNLVSNYSADNPRIPFMVDNYGDIRWVVNYSSHPDLNKLSYDNGIRRLRNGDFYFGDIATDKIYEIDLLGKILKTWDLNASGFIFHHDIYEKPDGNLIASVTKISDTHANGSETIEDHIVEIDRQTGAIKTDLDLKQSLDEYRSVLFQNPYDWMHVNSVLYDSTDNTVIVSGRHQCVVKLTMDNKVKWILAAHRAWGVNRRGEDLNQFLLTPLDANGNRITDTAVLNGTIDHPDFEWSWYQHSVIQIPNGDLMMFDNGATRNYNDSAAKYSRAVEYKIDPVNMTIQQKWQYGKERGLETYSLIVSKVQFLPKSNHVLFCPGYMVKNYNGLGGKIVEVDYATKQVVSQISISAANGFGFHRAERISAYPE